MSPFKKILISVFIVCNLLIMIRAHVPLEKKFFSTIYKPIDKYLNFFSLYQNWMMFAPDPARLNSYISADVEFMDGTTETYVFPRSSLMNMSEKYMSGEKYRKIISEGIGKIENSFMWEDTAKFALRKLKETSFHKIPLKVYLSAYWDEIPDMKNGFRPHLAKISSYKKETFYSYEVIK